MKIHLLFLLLCIFLFLLFKNSVIDTYDTYTLDTPKIIHLIYFPWDSTTQQLKENTNDFDKSALLDMQRTQPNYNVRMWTLPDCKQFVRQFYPDYEHIIFNTPRPVMMVDILRLLIVYHYGGIYWQYGSKPLVDMDNFLPSVGKNVKLFTEIILTPEFANTMKNEPIRKGEPEELIRVCTQIFSANPRHPYLLALFKNAVQNMQTYPIVRDYDILYTTGNAMMSTMYEKVGRYQQDIELVGNDRLKEMIYITSNGSWRIKKIIS